MAFSNSIAVYVSLGVSTLALVLSTIWIIFEFFIGVRSKDLTVMDSSLASYRRRVLYPTELRFRLELGTPCIFLGSPLAHNGPIRDKPIYFLDGESGTPPPFELHGSDRQSTWAESKDTLGWIHLLSACRLMESQSAEWQFSQAGIVEGHQSGPLEGRTITVAFQLRSVEEEDSGREYAITTLGHFVEMTVLLGLRWTIFDLDLNIFRAEGNGYLVQARRTERLGLTFRFFQVHNNSFEKDRVIPAREIQELCFGFLPTFLREEEFVLRCAADAHEEAILHTLQLGSPQDLADTFTDLGCKKDIQNIFLDQEKVITHLFPVPFELMGMLGRPIHIRNTSFRRIPNPTIRPWKENEVDLPTILTIFEQYLEYPYNTLRTFQTDEMIKRIKSINVLYDTEPKGCSFKLLNELHQAIDIIDSYLTQESWLAVNLTLRAHFETVLGLLNDGSGTFETLDIDPLISRELSFMRIYFDTVRPTVTGIRVANTNLSTEHVPNNWDGLSGQRTRPRDGAALGIEDKRLDIWLCLVFRMICWLMLHTFHKRDIMTPRSESLRSRLTVHVI